MTGAIHRAAWQAHRGLWPLADLIANRDPDSALTFIAAAEVRARDGDELRAAYVLQQIQMKVLARDWTGAESELWCLCSARDDYAVRDAYNAHMKRQRSGGPLF